MDKRLEIINSALLPEDLLLQLVEEMGELSQVIAKRIRIKNGRNPTPKTLEENNAELVEELADVLLCCNVIKNLDKGFANVDKIQEEKLNRWCLRIESALASEFR